VISRHVALKELTAEFSNGTSFATNVIGPSEGCNFDLKVDPQPLSPVDFREGTPQLPEPFPVVNVEGPEDYPLIVS